MESSKSAGKFGRSPASALMSTINHAVPPKGRKDATNSGRCVQHCGTVKMGS